MGNHEEKVQIAVVTATPEVDDQVVALDDTVDGEWTDERHKVQRQPSTPQERLQMGSAPTLESDPTHRPLPAREGEQLRPGTRLGHFRIDRLLGVGGMGQVYCARDVSLERDVALKVLPGEVSENPHIIERFVHEARAQARLAHPHVVPIYFIGEHGGRFYFAMELLEASLHEHCTDQLLQPQQAVEYLRGAADALRLASEHGLVHRDIKPGNLLLDRGGRIKIADFGLAKTAEALHGDGAFVGTPLYAPPEQLRGESIDHRADMYALGASFFHLLAGRPPFPISSVEEAKQVDRRNPPDLTEIRSDVPRSLARVVRRLMAQDPRRRYAQWTDAVAAIDRAVPKPQIPGGLIPRTLAVCIDLLGLGAMAIVPTGDGVVGPFALVPWLLYVVVALGWRGRTVGMWLFNLKATDSHGEALSWWGAALRTIVQFWAVFVFVGVAVAASALQSDLVPQVLHEEGELVTAGFACFGIAAGLAWIVGALAMGFNRKKLALHDLITRTRVFYG